MLSNLMRLPKVSSSELFLKILEGLFAAISVDTSLPKKRRRDREDVGQEVAMNDIEENVDRLNPASNLQTVCVQTYQNYKLALKYLLS
jgi:hypothetical protein